jgi:hypothetical protein
MAIDVVVGPAFALQTLAARGGLCRRILFDHEAPVLCATTKLGLCDHEALSRPPPLHALALDARFLRLCGWIC